MINKKILTLSMVAVLGMAVTAQAAVMGSWTNTGNNYKFGVTSDIGNITSLELKFVPAAGSTFAIEFDDTIFDSDGLLAGFADTFILFPASVTSPGATQGKNANLLQAAFTGFTPFATKNVAQLLLNGTPANPIASNIAGTQGRFGTAVVETIAGDPLSRQEFPILGGEITDIAPVVADLGRPSDTGLVDILGEVINLQPVDTAPGTPPIAWSVALPTYTKGFGAPDHAFGLGAATYSMNPTTGAFQFNSLGSTRGTYVWTGTASGPGGTDTFAITVDVTVVPEPATLSLFGLALVGFVGFARRRS